MEEKRSFRVVFGESPVIKVIDFFLDNREFDYSLTEIASNANVGWSSLCKLWNDFVKTGLVTKTRRIGRAQLYKLNTVNPIIKKLIELDDEISKQFVHAALRETEIISEKQLQVF